jgi:putative chitinase
MAMITLSQLQTIMPGSRGQAQIFLEPLNEAMQEFSINTCLRIAAFLAQIQHETGNLNYIIELATGDAYTNREDLGNTTPEARSIAARHGMATGPLYKGRGLLQITGYTNYADCGKALGLACAENPKLLIEPVNAARSAAWFWCSRGLNALADKQDIRGITKRINGGYNGLNNRIAAYKRALKAFGIEMKS